MKVSDSIVTESFFGKPLSEDKLEIVERKGLGHPDSICDGVMEFVSIQLAAEYQKRFGTVLHHNLDKSLLCAGSAECKFGGGTIKSPMRLIMGDRATWKADGKEIPVGEIAIAAAKEWFRNHFRFLDPEQHVEYQLEIKPGSSELQNIFSSKKKISVANDTSAGVGYAPFSETERCILETERYLNSKIFKQDFPDTGEDVKIMAIRKGKDLHLTIAMPLIDRFIENERNYFLRKMEILKVIREFVRERYQNFRKIEINLNTLDIKGKGIDGIYLSVLGTSAEVADSGEVGRGNRVNGLISFGRPCSLEAAAGKNAISHVGKIYNVFANKVAAEIYETISGIHEVYVTLVSRIGSPINLPEAVSIKLNLKKNARALKITNQAQQVVERELSAIQILCKDLLQGKYAVY